MNQADFDLFFENPDVRRDGPGEFGILYLLRRDINRCLVLGVGSWLGAMGVMAGVDLLGKFSKETTTLARLVNGSGIFLGNIFR